MMWAPAFRRRAYTKAPATRQAKYKEFFMSLIRLNEMLGTRPAALFVLAEPVRDEFGERVERLLRVGAGGEDGDRRSESGAKRQDAHD